MIRFGPDRLPARLGILRLRRSLVRLGLDRRGVSAVEFALIAPVLIMIYFGVGELSEAMMAQRRTAHATSAIGDLATQSPSIASSDVADIFAAASTIMQPFSTASLELRMTSVTVNAQGAAAVDWSCAIGGLAAYGKGAAYSGLPIGLVSVPGDSVVVAEGLYHWASPANYVVPGGLSFSEVSYFKPRQSSQVAGPSSC